MGGEDVAARGLKELSAGLAVGRGGGRGLYAGRVLEGGVIVGGVALAGRGVVGAGEDGPGSARSGVLPWPPIRPEASRGPG